MKEDLKILQKGHASSLEKLYLDYRASFLNFCKRYELNEDDILDIYQDAFLALREHALNGKLESIKSSVKTYLFSIGKYMAYDRLKKNQKTASVNGPIEDQDTYELQDNFEEPILSTEQKLLRDKFIHLGKRCQEMLTLFYYRGLTIEEITESLGYENKNVVKSQKSRCLKSLKDLIKTP